MDLVQPFRDPALVNSYTEDTPRRVPGLADLHRMAMLLLAEHAPRDADILVLGAGGGLELRAFAQAQPDWRFVGVDPSAAMLDVAIRTLGSLQKRARLQQGYIDTAPQGPFDGATCLLTLHFLSADERSATLQQIRRRLKPGAPLIVAHHSYPTDGDLLRWLSRSAAFANTSNPSGVDFAGAATSAAAMAARLPIMSANEDETLIRDAGFSDVSLFYAAFSFRGWLATA